MTEQSETAYLFATIPKNAKEEIRIGFDTFNGHKLVNIRVWYRDDDGTMRPGKSGLAFKIEKMAEFAQAIAAAAASVAEPTKRVGKQAPRSSPGGDLI